MPGSITAEPAERGIRQADLLAVGEDRLGRAGSPEQCDGEHHVVPEHPHEERAEPSETLRRAAVVDELRAEALGDDDIVGPGPNTLRDIVVERVRYHP